MSNDDELTPDQRLRNVAADALAGYKTGRVSLRRLIDDLDTVWNNVLTSEWSDEYRGHWWTLEQVYAVALDRNQLNALPPESVAAISEAVSGLESLLASWPIRTE